MLKRLPSLACVLALACGPHSPPALDGGRDGGAPSDGGVDAGDAGPDTCERVESWESFGIPEVPYFGTATGTVIAVDASGIDVDVGTTRHRFVWPGDWPGSGIDRIEAGTEVELAQLVEGSRLEAPDVTLHAYLGQGFVRPEHFTGPIVVDGAPPLALTESCAGTIEGACGPVGMHTYELSVGASERLAPGEHTSGEGYAVYFASSAFSMGARRDGCIDEAWFHASFALRVDRNGGGGP